MGRTAEIVKDIAEVVKNYPPSLMNSVLDKKLFDNVKTYVMFLGYSRSGHSLIGALLDAHPDIVIAHELDTLKYITARYRKRQIYNLLLKNSQSFARNGQRTKHFSYEVPNQWQGKFNTIQVIGDKQGEGSTLRLQARPGLLGSLQKIIDDDKKLIHVARNPYDNISTISKKTKRHGRSLNLRESVDYYFSLCKTVADTKSRIESSRFYELRHESFIDDPKTILNDLCIFVGVSATDDYLSDCAGIVYKSPNKSRRKSPWNQELIDLVRDRMKEFPFLKGYSYED
ncbi:hypothetical protein MNBD_NITROSPINAE02-1151 [hydrothermal vent metagenome]|uniref:Sulfotransferase n=1 Tax=hydrothermal vent metagenome TaxID=652676 RepID=A0A3B1CN50_9ZZZZ